MRLPIAVPVGLVFAMSSFRAFAQELPPLPGSEAPAAPAPAATPAPASAPAVAAPPPPAWGAPPPSQETATLPREPASPVWKVDTGYRGAFITDAGLNPFAKNDYFAQFSLAASRRLFELGRIAFAPGLAWDVGSSSGTARGAPTTLMVHRLSIPLEGRFGFAPWLYVFGRVAPGVMAISAKLEDPSGPATLTANEWVPAVDVSVGAAWRFAAAGRRRVGFWVTAEGGYAWAKSMSLTMTPDVPSDDPRHMGPLDLGTLAMRSAYMRLGVAVSF